MAHPAKRTPARIRNTTPSTPRNRHALSFVTWGKFPGGAIGIRSHWCVPHDPRSLWDQGKKIGRMLFDEVRQLAADNPDEALLAIVCALNTPDWKTSGWGIEQGFTEALAEFALIGMQAARQEVRHAA